MLGKRVDKVGLHCGHNDHLLSACKCASVQVCKCVYAQTKMHAYVLHMLFATSAYSDVAVNGLTQCAIVTPRIYERKRKHTFKDTFFLYKLPKSHIYNGLFYLKCNTETLNLNEASKQKWEKAAMFSTGNKRCVLPPIASLSNSKYFFSS